MKAVDKNSKAVKFVKQVGWGDAKKLLENSWNDFSIVKMGCATDGFEITETINTSELKTLVEAKELVDNGLPELKKAMFSESKDLDYVRNWINTVSEKLLTEKGIKLKQAIKLVESVEND